MEKKDSVCCRRSEADGRIRWVKITQKNLDGTAKDERK